MKLKFFEHLQAISHRLKLILPSLIPQLLYYKNFLYNKKRNF